MSAEPLHKSLWQGNQALAEECLAHPFIRGLGDGSLDREDFKHYVAQDAAVQGWPLSIGGLCQHVRPPHRVVMHSHTPRSATYMAVFHVLLQSSTGRV